MDLSRVFQRLPDHESCTEHLEKVRWGDNPACSYCGGLKVARTAENHRVGRWSCHDCRSSFNALAGTIFRKTKIDLQKWFLAISIVLNAKKSVSSHQLVRDLETSCANSRASSTMKTLMAGLIIMEPLGPTKQRNINRFMGEAGALTIAGIEYSKMQTLTVGEIIEGERFKTPTVMGRHERQPILPSTPTVGV